MVDSGAGRRRVSLRAAIAGALAVGALGAFSADGSIAADEDASVRVATTGNGSELVKTLPITPKRGADKEVVMSLRPGTLPGLAAGDRLRLTSEFQITVNCGFP